MLGASCSVEIMKLIGIKIVLQPSSMQSSIQPPWPLMKWAEGKFSNFGRIVIPVAIVAGRAFSKHRRHINNFRKSIGLESLPIFKPSKHPENNIVLCPNWFARPAPDWPKGTLCAGFPLETAIEIPELEDTKGAFVIVGGTGVNALGQLIDKACYLASRFDRRVIVLSNGEVDNCCDDSRVTVLSFRELSGVLRHAQTIVHHGGVGTTAEAIRSAVPQIIIADRFDQPDNGIRVAQLGLGGVILKNNPPLKIVGDIVEKVNSSKFINDQVKTACNLVQREDGISNAVSEILRIANL